eukprot:Seg1603.16 transcript_id=Seg1603.16/GoldUCD/mRNA.D3Y31 product="hypothetical protein" protein_id=Seg1603.16/GoldUCD/D3Y31
MISKVNNPSFTPEEELDNHFKEIQENVKQKYSDVKTIPGDWSKRDLNTFAKKKPTLKELNYLQGILMGLEMHSPIEKPVEYLWDVNCAMYATIYGWKLSTSENKSENNNSSNRGKQGWVPAWEKRINEKMNRIRGKISQITEEIQRIRNNKNLTRNMRRNRRWMKRELKGKITLNGLLGMKEHKISIVKSIKHNKEKKKDQIPRNRMNRLFDSDQGKVYNTFREILKNDQSEDVSFKTKNDKAGNQTTLPKRILKIFGLKFGVRNQR